MKTLICYKTGKTVTLEKKIGGGGEGEIWRTNQDGKLAKVYQKKLDNIKIEKLKVMIDYPPTDPYKSKNHISYAWPESLLKGENQIVGFLMPEIKGAKEFLEISNITERKKAKLEINWQFLHVTAMNIANLMRNLHTEGYVVGDMKPANIMVNSRALPSIVDTDSFQLRDPKRGSLYRCPVTSENFTPPELIGENITEVDQTVYHDAFRLGALIHLLLTSQYYHQGLWCGTGEAPIVSKKIREGLWPYGANSLIKPSDKTIPLEVMHPRVQELFLRCFNDGHNNPRLRPTADDWFNALRVAVNDLVQCDRVKTHIYAQHYRRCYWCERAWNLKTDIFPAMSGYKRYDSTKISPHTPTSVRPLKHPPTPTPSNIKPKPWGKIIFASLFGVIILLPAISAIWQASGNTTANYQKLEKYLSQKQWEKADNETYTIMLKLTNRRLEGDIDIESVSNFPCEDLHKIDKLWTEYSNGKFGFYVQHKIYQSLGGRFGESGKMWREFGYNVGWRNQKGWLSYSNLKFSLSYPGQLPAGWVRGWRTTGNRLGKNDQIFQSLGNAGYYLRWENWYKRVEACGVNNQEVSASTSPYQRSYKTLESLLSQEEWRSADLKTRYILFNLQREEEQNVESLINFPCEDLFTIDKLWVKYSNGKFGFSVQKDIYNRVNDNRKYYGNYRNRVRAVRKFGNQVGWLQNRESVKYSNLTFNLDTAMIGHIPAIGSWRSWMDVENVFYRLEVCERRLRPQQSQQTQTSKETIEVLVSQDGNLEIKQLRSYQEACATGKPSASYYVKDGVSGVLYPSECNKALGNDALEYRFVDTSGNERCTGKTIIAFGGLEAKAVTYWEIQDDASGDSNCTTKGERYDIKMGY